MPPGLKAGEGRSAGLPLRHCHRRRAAPPTHPPPSPPPPRRHRLRSLLHDVLAPLMLQVIAAAPVAVAAPLPDVRIDSVATSLSEAHLCVCMLGGLAISSNGTAQAGSYGNRNYLADLLCICVQECSLLLKSAVLECEGRDGQRGIPTFPVTRELRLGKTQNIMEREQTSVEKEVMTDGDRQIEGQTERCDRLTDRVAQIDGQGVERWISETEMLDISK